MDKRLIIVQSVNDFSKLKSHISETSDLLVLTQNAMSLLDERGVGYKVIEDYYTPDQYYKDTIIYNNRFGDLLSRLDKACNSVTGFPYAYSGNEHYLLTLFHDLLYLEKLAQIIQSQYIEVFLYAPKAPIKLSNKYLSFSELNYYYRAHSVISLHSEREAKRKIQLLYSYVDIGFIEDSSAFNALGNISFNLKLKYFSHKLRRYVEREFVFNRNTKHTNNQLRGRSIYVIQDGYEVAYLKKYLPRLKYLNPTIKLRQDVELEEPVDMSCIAIDDILQCFIEDYFIFFGKYIDLLINSYHLEVAGRVRYFMNRFEYLINKDKPSLLLFSIGTRDVFDSICGYIANCYNIPVFFFQHGGHSLFGYVPNQNKLENNKIVLKTLIAQSCIEVRVLDNEATKAHCMGSIQQYEVNNKNNSCGYTKDVLYCLGPDSDLIFRQLLNYYSINKKHKQSLDVISTFENTSLSVDIKLHPIGETNSYDCYTRIIRNNKYRNACVLYGSFVEVLSKNYGLIIIDYFQSAAIRHIMSLKVPVIVYDYDIDRIHVSSEILSDLKKRCYIARNKTELCEYLEKYQRRKLDSKWSLDFIDKYVYPVDNENPGNNIAEYIENVVSINKYKYEENICLKK